MILFETPRRLLSEHLQYFIDHGFGDTTSDAPAACLAALTPEQDVEVASDIAGVVVDVFARYGMVPTVHDAATDAAVVEWAADDWCCWYHAVPPGCWWMHCGFSGYSTTQRRAAGVYKRLDQLCSAISSNPREMFGGLRDL